MSGRSVDGAMMGWVLELDNTLWSSSSGSYEHTLARNAIPRVPYGAGACARPPLPVSNALRSSNSDGSTADRMVVNADLSSVIFFRQAHTLGLTTKRGEASRESIYTKASAPVCHRMGVVPFPFVVHGGQDRVVRSRTQFERNRGFTKNSKQTIQSTV